MMTLEDITYSIGDFSIKNVSLTVKKNEYFVLLGPTGAGKTILLELIAGFRIPQAGRIILYGRDVTFNPPEKRNVGFVYQDYALFPHMTVEDNIAFGLKVRKFSEAEIKRRVKELMKLIGISHLKNRYPQSLSGGEQQRVSLARALAINPKILLLDEPLSALDPQTRETLRSELKKIHETQDVTTIHVTHDQSEAMILADRVGVIMNGKIIQVGKPKDLFNKPKSESVAVFLGAKNVLRGKILSNEGGVATIDVEGHKIYAITDIKEGDVNIIIRPENIVLSRTPLKSSARNTFEGNVVNIIDMGPFLDVEISNGLRVFITKQSASDLGLKVGEKVYASFKATATHISRRNERS